MRRRLYEVTEMYALIGSGEQQHAQLIGFLLLGASDPLLVLEPAATRTWLIAAARIGLFEVDRIGLRVCGADLAHPMPWLRVRASHHCAGEPLHTHLARIDADQQRAPRCACIARRVVVSATAS